MRLVGTITATCVLALLAGCATSKQAPISSRDGPASNAVADATVPPPAPPPPPPSPVMVAPSAQGRVAAESAHKLARPGYMIPPVMVATDPGRERYEGKEVSPVHLTRAEPVSTFSVDVDTGAYANARRFISGGALPPRDAVRSEELINYFRYDYARPATRETPFTVTTDVAATPWNPATRLLRIGLRGYDLPSRGRPPANLVFLVDVSGSMSSEDKLPLVRTALAGLAGELGPQDRVSIVVYAGAAGLVLEPTNDPARIRGALERLSAGGSTAGGAGLQLAYNVARDNFVKGGVNRILLATDGDFNVGISNNKALIEMVERGQNFTIFAVAVFLAVGVAPLAEEFLFRILLQGWLEARQMRGRAERQLNAEMLENIAAKVENAESSQVVSVDSDNPYAPPPAIASSTMPIESQADTTIDLVAGQLMPGWAPLITSAVIFALLHATQGPDPIALLPLALVLGYLYRQTHRIVPSLVAHAFLNATSMLLLWLNLA